MSKEDIENIPEDMIDLPEESSQEEKPFWRPPKWTDPAALQVLIDEYFQRCIDWYVQIRKNVLYEYQMAKLPERIKEWEMSRWEFEEEKEFQKRKPQEPEKEYVEKVEERPTITWLALYLWCDIETIKNYKQKDDFSRPIKEAYLKVQLAYEERLQWTTPTWAIFALKNFDWKDKTESENTLKGSLTLADWLIALTKIPQKEEK